MFARIAALTMATFVGVVTSQMPEFVQQYRQRLGGAIDELTTVIKDFDTSARRLGVSRDKAIERLESNPDPLAADGGIRMRNAVDRLDRLTEQRVAFIEAGPFRRLVVFVGGADMPLAQATAGDFEPAIPLNAEGAVTAGVGFLAGLGLWRVLAGLTRLVFRRRRAPPAEDAGPAG